MVPASVNRGGTGLTETGYGFQAGVAPGLRAVKYIIDDWSGLLNYHGTGRAILAHIILNVILLSSLALGQVITWDPAFPQETDTITVTFNAAGTPLEGYTGTVYTHTGVTTNLGAWQHVIDEWGDVTQPSLTSIGIGTHILVIENPRTFYKITSTNEKIEGINFVFRSSNSSNNYQPQTADLFMPVFDQIVNIRFLEPMGDEFVALGESVAVAIMAASLESGIATMELWEAGNLLTSVDNDTLTYVYIPTAAGLSTLLAVAKDSTGNIDSSTVQVIVNPTSQISALPAGIVDGINYIDDNTVTLSLFAPNKQFVYLIGEFNDWLPDTNYFMDKSTYRTDSLRFWITLTDLEAGREYAFQYWVDGETRIADPYTEKILDPWNDQYFLDHPTTYPNLMSYPHGKTGEAVSVFQTNQTPFVWQHTDTYERPPKSEIVIYELLLREFIAAHDFATLADTLDYLVNLGVDAIELMPFNEFEGNSSWGYNPSFYFAPDKYYGPEESLKQFIDAAHGRGLAVIMDMVLNHSYGQSPMVRMYWDEPQNRPAPDNPWYNAVSPNPVFAWGNDFNHDSPHTREFIDRVNKYWLTEYQLDGYRFDFTKGFTQTPGDGGANDPARIAILKRMADAIWQTDSTAYVILEHFADNTEEKELTAYGMLVWGNTNYNYNEATMGWNDGGKSNFSWGYYGSRDFPEPHLVTYMESHDEERLMVKNLAYGDISGDYSIKSLNTALNRNKLAAAFFLTLPGPKMIWQFGELGYDISIDDPCRICEKPIKWDYFADPDRRRLYDTYAALLALRKASPVFTSALTAVLLNLGSSSGLKKITMTNTDMDVLIIGNFGVTKQNITTGFPNTGRWYDYFSGDSVEVIDVSMIRTLLPGEFNIYTTRLLATPAAGLLALPEFEPTLVPDKFALGQNYPNPFNPSTRIDYTLPSTGKVRLSIYDLRGRLVRQLVDTVQPTGSYVVNWSGTNEDGQPLPSGIYFYRLEAGGYTASNKMLLLK
ncbi:alpha-amylase family glycosyl hydrolase [Candidatus Neomarinimicrobiota bacterium]